MAVGNVGESGPESHTSTTPFKVEPMGAEKDRQITMAQQLPQPPVLEPWSFRHPSVRHFAPLFEYTHLPLHLQEISAHFEATARALLDLCHDGLELSAALRKLLEAKDCAVRQAVLDRRGLDGGN